MTGPALDISVIIPVLDDGVRLGLCLAALERQDTSADFEVLVVDNGSSDDPASIVARYARARLLREPRRSSYAARNRGVACARGAILAFTDSDCIPARDWLRRGLARLNEGLGAQFVGGAVGTFAQTPSRPTAVELYESLHAFPQRDYVEKLGFSVTANLFVARPVFDAVGEFSSDLESSGDREWGERASAAGVRGIYAADVRVDHPRRRSLPELNRKAKRLCRGDAQLRALRGEPRRPIRLRPFVRPPVRGTLRNLGQLRPPTVRSKVLYASVAVAVHYINAVQQTLRRTPS
jgi:glycosyltransferase involved in cell wall biosynthesis